jgi:CRP/FNR family cyclic AMP-dependent transcriptional regulator
VVYRGQARSVLFGENGREMTLALHKAGDFFGETSLFDGQPNPANVVAVDDVVTLVLDRHVFMEYLRQSPEMMMRMLSAMAERVRHADELVGSLALQDVLTRLTKTLLSIGEQHGEYREEGLLIPYRPTQQELANMVGTCRETVSRALSSMGKRGLVVSRGRTLLFASRAD